ncbi:hypothetical protein AUK22_05625 [bacterium CG2_30_54_10]|nr:MAG: hypothetical protein AUK22_05625 [bacterium CG2_30_54_10]
MRKVDWVSIPQILVTADPLFFVLLLVSITVEQLIRAWRWQLILKGHAVPFWESYRGLLLGYFFNNVLPARAGEFIRAGYLGRKGILSSSEAFGSVVLERFADGIVVVCFIFASLVLFPVSPVIRQAGYSAMVFYFLVLIAIIFLQFRKEWMGRVTSFFLGFLPERFRERAVTAQDSFIGGLGLIRDPSRFLLVVVVSFVAWSASVFSYYLALKIFHLPLGLDAAILLIAVLSLGAMIPSSPGMIGIFEYCCMLVLSDMLQVQREVAASFGLFTHFVSYVYILAIGIAILACENLSFHELQSHPR